MSPRRRDLLLALCAGPSLLTAPAARAQAPFIPQEGVDYTAVARPQPTDSPGKIEVLDFFWYGCPHCYHFLPDLEAWRKRQPEDVVYKHVPVDFGDSGREPHTRLFYTLQILGRLDLHTKVFDAFHVDHKHLLDTNEIADFMAMPGNDIPRDKWLATFNSFSVANMVNRARATFQAYGIDGTPTIAIDGRFLTSPSMVASRQTNPNRAAIATMDFVIDRVRKERPHRKS
jgi:thiol:disulfide interchange protein DsbA